MRLPVGLYRRSGGGQCHSGRADSVPANHRGDHGDDGVPVGGTGHCGGLPWGSAAGGGTGPERGALCPAVYHCGNGAGGDSGNDPAGPGAAGSGHRGYQCGQCHFAGAAGVLPEPAADWGCLSGPLPAGLRRLNERKRHPHGCRLRF